MFCESDLRLLSMLDDTALLHRDFHDFLVLLRFALMHASSSSAATSAISLAANSSQ